MTIKSAKEAREKFNHLSHDDSCIEINCLNARKMLAALNWPEVRALVKTLETIDTEIGGLILNIMKENKTRTTVRELFHISKALAEFHEATKEK